MMTTAARKILKPWRVFRPAAAWAAGAWLGTPALLNAAAIESPIKAKEFKDIIVAIADWAAAIAIPLTTLMVIWAGYLYLLSGGSEESIKKAKNAITWAVVGLIVVLISKSLSVLIQNVLGAK